jgi:AraC family transcriptional regulator, regulatory protein of adaptative response / methylated-DNA-[protein]-cysteine methyltransferase
MPMPIAASLSEDRETTKIGRMRATVRRCSLGHVLVATTPRGVCAIVLGDERDTLFDHLRTRFPGAQVDEADAPLEQRADAVVQMIDRTAAWPRDFVLDLRGTDFQQRVWRALQAIPAGATSTYAEIARRIGSPRAVRAVGTACGQNPVAIAVPCHRVLRGDGSLGGYRWGVERKQALLDSERARPS